MARERGLEEVVNEQLAETPGGTQRAMFGGIVWMLNGNVVCRARKESLLVRLGKDNDAWALKISGVTPLMRASRRMHGLVEVTPEIFGNDKLRHKLVKAALDFNQSLPKKD
jgi:TfoX N-terminal domain